MSYSLKVSLFLLGISNFTFQTYCSFPRSSRLEGNVFRISVKNLHEILVNFTSKPWVQGEITFRGAAR